MRIVHQSALFSSTLRPTVPLLAAPPKRLALPAPKPLPLLATPRESAPKIAGYLPVPQMNTVSVASAPVKREKRVVEAEIANPLLLIDIRKDFDAWWAEFERIHGRVKSIEEMDAEIEAKHPGYLAWVARRKARAAQAEATRS